MSLHELLLSHHSPQMFLNLKYCFHFHYLETYKIALEHKQESFLAHLHLWSEIKILQQPHSLLPFLSILPQRTSGTQTGRRASVAVNDSWAEGYSGTLSESTQQWHTETY